MSLVLHGLTWGDLHFMVLEAMPGASSCLSCGSWWLRLTTALGLGKVVGWCLRSLGFRVGCSSHCDQGSQCYLVSMKSLGWVFGWLAVWAVMVIGGLWLLPPLFATACADCVGGHPLPGGGYYFGESGFFVDWGTVVPVSLLLATAVTGALVVGSRAVRRLQP